LTYQLCQETLSRKELKPLHTRKGQRFRVTQGDASMTIKTSALWESAGQLSTAGNSPRAAWELLSPLRSELPTHERITELGFDGFQVALVPFQSMAASAGGNRTPEPSASRVLLLPMTWKELMVQVREEIGRPSATPTLVRFGDVSFDLVSMEVRRSNRLVTLTRMEFKVLKYFVSNPNRMISREDLLDQVWGYDNYPCTRTVDNHILRLRQKLEPDITHPVHFQTVHGLGYKFTP
jgi:transcriptional regulator